MPHDEKNPAGIAGDVGPIGETADENETFGEALSKAGFEPAKVGRKIVPQGKRRETLEGRPSRPTEERSSPGAKDSCSEA
jgi:hypothetical protein